MYIEAFCLFVLCMKRRRSSISMKNPNLKPGEAITHQIVDRPVGSFDVRPGRGQSRVEVFWVDEVFEAFQKILSELLSTKAGNTCSLNGFLIPSI